MARRSHSTLDDPEVKSLVQSMLAAGKTYDEISATVLKETGKPITRSAISRGKLRWDSAAAQLAALRADAEILERIVRDNPQDLSGATTALFQAKILERAKNVQEGFDDATLLELGQLQVKIERTRLMGEAVKVQRERLELIKNKALAAAEQVKAAMSEAGVPGDKIAEAVDRILGVTA